MFAAADQVAVSGETPHTCDRSTVKRHVGEARQTLQAGWAKKKWRDRSPVKPAQRRQIAGHLRCLERGKDRKAVKRYAQRRKEAFFMHRAYRRVAPYPGLRGEGYWLRWLAVPAWVVAAETRGYHGEGRWRASNPSSGACGPYQLNGHTSCDTSSAEDKLRHHQVAASLPRGSWEVGY